MHGFIAYLKSLVILSNRTDSAEMFFKDTLNIK